MHVVLPPRLYRAKTIRVHSLTTVQASIELDFGTSVNRIVVIEGFNKNYVPSDQSQEAHRSLIALLGSSRDLFLYMAPQQDAQTPALARVYIAERLPVPLEAGLATPPGLTEPFLEVASAMAWLAQFKYAKSAAIKLLSGAFVGAPV